MDFFLMFLAIAFLLIALIALARKVQRDHERLDNLDFIVQILRAKYNIDLAEKKVDISVDTVEDSDFG